MSATVYNFDIEKGVDFSGYFILQKADGSYFDLNGTGTCVKSEIVEFYGLAPITGFTITEVLPSGAILTLNEQGTSILPFGECYYDIVVNVTGSTQRVRKGTITTIEAATQNISC